MIPLAVYILLLSLAKSFKLVTYVTIMMGLLPKNQIFLIGIIYSLRKTYTPAILLSITQLKKVKLFVLKKKINTGLFFSKIMLNHITVFSLITILLTILPKPITTYKSILSLQLSLILFNVLGIYWSSQENLWGGAWDWNLIEVSLLILTVILVLPLHAKKVIIYWEVLIVITFTVYLVYNHTPVVLSIHNFSNNKLTKYTLLIPIFSLVYRYKRTKNAYILSLILVWFIQFTKLEVPNILVKTLIVAFTLYYTLHIKKNNILWQVNWLALLLLIISSAPWARAKCQLTLWFHKTIFSLAIIVVAYQGSYTPAIPFNYVVSYIPGIKVNQFLVINESFSKVKQLKPVYNVGVDFKNSNIVSNSYLN